MVRTPDLESKVGLGSVSRKMSFYRVHMEKLFGSTQGPEMVLECSGLMIARGVILKRI